MIMMDVKAVKQLMLMVFHIVDVDGYYIHDPMDLELTVDDALPGPS